MENSIIFFYFLFLNASLKTLRLKIKISKNGISSLILIPGEIRSNQKLLRRHFQVGDIEIETELKPVKA